MRASDATTLTGSAASGLPRGTRKWTAVGVVLCASAAASAVGFWWSVSPSVRDVRTLAARGRSYLRLGRPELAFQAVSDVRDDELGAAEAVAVAAQALIRLGQYRVARLALERALRLEPDQFEPTVALAELNADLGDRRRAADVFAKAAHLRPRDARVWLALGRVLKDQLEYHRAIRAYAKVLELSAGHRAARSELIECLVDNGQPDQASPWIAGALADQPQDPVVLGLAARAAFETGRKDDAIRLADHALAHDPENVAALLARARVRVAGARWREALPDAERAVAIAPYEPSALQLLAIIEDGLGESSRAAETRQKRKHVEEALRSINDLAAQISQHPEEPEYHWKMGKIAWEMGGIRLASRCFEEAIALDPSFQPARESLAQLRTAVEKGERSNRWAAGRLP
jgi:tetratricopeptide (TPR) repeat protein